jgi:hypothetical protein
MTSDEQLAEWVKGNPIHNEDRDECCPDFSCCDKALLADEQTRKAFVEADEVLRISFLGAFLSKAFDTSGVHLVGFDDPENRTLQ